MASALIPTSWPFDSRLLPETACVVGGSVRDALLDRQADYLDLDFVLPDGAVAIASAIARRYQVGFVVLDADNQIARAVFDQATIDFAQQVGPTLETDLQRRDFTINAIAYHPQSDRLIDPLNGIADLRQQILRMVSRENLAEDPLRLLRAYRQAAQLGFAIDGATRRTIRELAPLLQNIAAERIRHELDALLSQTNGATCFRMAWQDGLLDAWLPHLRVEHTEQLAALDRALVNLPNIPGYADLLHSWKDPVPAGHYRSWIKAARLSRLLPLDEDEANRWLTRLKYSRNEGQAIFRVLQTQPYLDQMAAQAGDLSRSDQFFMFKAASSSFPAVSLVALSMGIPIDAVAAMVERYQNPKDPMAHPVPLVSGKDLMAQLNLRSGPQIGQLLNAIENAQASGELTCADEALAWAEQWFLEQQEQKIAEV
ncbi:CCA tRNA nucleotidyltransferase [Leptothoe sp. PORK10 BA2]|uniref:CCA tRNA nucleotidyltransferase n=1 Tax=Leptothoe sp. PORK10 BA2 TaxID=3110254 RepID=UPI002B1F5AB0|nr:CCA tRNA nucleotidyltransferase [Leptothoe sp. PORK10 BA2]MEA5462300.1 CCA tRNA nucleotidyltransferase [Leptothoe sp. PORK10 BA2]